MAILYVILKASKIRHPMETEWKIEKIHHEHSMDLNVYAGSFTSRSDIEGARLDAGAWRYL